MKFLLILIIALFWVNPGKLTPKKVADGITVPIPEKMRPMIEGEVVLQSPSVRAPLASYTSIDRTADFTVNLSATQWPDQDHKLAKKFFKASIRALFDRIDIVQEGIRTVNGLEYIYFEFESRMNGSRMNQGGKEPILRYHFIQYLLEADRTLVFSFHCPRTLRDQWETTAHKMMEGIKVR